MKTCTKCKTEKPKAEFNKHKKNKDGLQSHCKQCRHDHYTDNAEAIIAKTRARYSVKSVEILAQKREYYLNNKEDIDSYQREYRSCKYDALKAYSLEYYQENADAIKAKVREYSAANPDKCAAHSRNRRARVRNAEGSHTAADVKAIFEYQRGKCANCNKKLFKSGAKKFHVDHIHPLAKGGSNWPSNLQCLCCTCNLKKSAKDPLDWAFQNGKLL